MVPQSSAVVPGAVDAEPIAILATHLDMVKYPAANDNGYEKVAGHLQLMIPDAGARVVDNWEKEERSKQSIVPLPTFSFIILTLKPLVPESYPPLNNAEHHEDGLRAWNYSACIDWLSFSDHDAREKNHCNRLPWHLDLGPD